MIDKSFLEVLQRSHTWEVFLSKITNIEDLEKKCKYSVGKFGRRVLKCLDYPWSKTELIIGVDHQENYDVVNTLVICDRLNVYLDVDVSERIYKYSKRIEFYIGIVFRDWKNSSYFRQSIDMECSEDMGKCFEEINNILDKFLKKIVKRG